MLIRYIEPGSAEAQTVDAVERALMTLLRVAGRDVSSPLLLAALMRCVRSGLAAGVVEQKITAEEAREWMIAWANLGFTVSVEEPESVN